MAEPRRAGTAGKDRNSLVKGSDAAVRRPASYAEMSANRLDQPRVPRRLRLPRISGETFGHFAEMFARFMGTARFLAYMSIFVLVWISLNVLGLYGLRWDPYPFILLNLFFSTQASYAAPLILLAQNRQADRDRLTTDEDRRRAAMQKADTEYLSRELASLRIALGEVATRDFIRSELLRLVDELGEASQRRQKLERKEQKQERKEQRSQDDRRNAGTVEFGSHGPKTGGESLDEPYDDLDGDLAGPPPDGSADHSPHASRG